MRRQKPTPSALRSTPSLGVRGAGKAAGGSASRGEILAPSSQPRSTGPPAPRLSRRKDMAPQTITLSWAKLTGRVTSLLWRRSRCWRLTRRPKSAGSCCSLFLLRSSFTRCVRPQNSAWDPRRHRLSLGCRLWHDAAGACLAEAPTRSTPSLPSALNERRLTLSTSSAKQRQARGKGAQSRHEIGVFPHAPFSPEPILHAVAGAAMRGPS